MRKRDRLKSVFFKIFMVMMVFFITVSFTMALYGLYLLQSIRGKIRHEGENAMHLYMSHLDNTMEQLEGVLYNMHGTYSARQLESRKDVGSLQWNIAQNTLISEYVSTLWLYTDLSSIFSYYDYGEDSAFVIRSMKEEEQRNNLDWKMQIGNYVNSSKEQRKYAGINWAVTDINGINYLLYLRRRGNCYYGVSINLDNLLKEWDAGEDSGYRCFFTYARETEDVPVSWQVEEDNEKTNAIRMEVMSSKANLKLVQEIPSWKIFTQISGFMILLFILGIVSCIAMPVIYYVIGKYVRNPINQLLDGIHHVEDGDLKYKIPEEKSEGEFGRVICSFNSMVSQISNLKITAYENQLEKQRIQMRYLTKQIQPHFILNTLNILYSYEPEEYPLIQKMILCLAKYFRYIVKVDQPFVPLYQELDHIRNYFEIQEARYPEIFYHYMEMGDELEEAQVPPLLIQNFVENSIKYALRMDSKVKIYVLAERIDKVRMRIRIADTGKGMPEETLDAIERFKKEKLSQKELGIGIQNAIERLSVIYRDEADICVYNSMEGGATVDISMPVIALGSYAEGGINGSSIVGG